MKFWKKATAIVMVAVCMATTIPANVSAAGTVTQKVVTPESGLPTYTKNNLTTVWVRSGNSARSYNIYYQKAKGIKKKSFLFKHGCAASALATVLSGYSQTYRQYTPSMVYNKLEKWVFGNKVWKKNYRKYWSNQRPLSLYGMSRIMTAVGIPNTYVRSFTTAQATDMISKHLYSGNPVVIEVNSRTQVNGVYARGSNNKWALTKHTLTLLGITDTGKVIVADSSDRPWSGNMQRIKYTTVEEIVQFLIPIYVVDTSVYYTKKGGGGFILVNPQP